MIPEKDHALLSPSSAHRWIVCTPSARLEYEAADSGSTASEEGSLAHAIGELMLYREVKIISQLNYDFELEKLQQHKLYKPEMLAYCRDYADFVIEQFNEYKANDPNAQLFIETKIDISAYIPEAFGTGDAAIVSRGTLHFIDLKYGKGVPVDAEDNAQLKLYAIGLLKLFELEYNIENVKATIYQPRIDNTSTWATTSDDLLDWVYDIAMPAAKKAFDGEGVFSPGEKQCQFCRIRATCKAYAEYNLELAKFAFKDESHLTDDEIVDILKKAKGFMGWLKAIEHHALSKAASGEKVWPGMKLVRGRSNRKYGDIEKIVAGLKNAGYRDTTIFKQQELKGISDLTAFIGKERFNDLVAPHLVKPKGKPALVPISDKRDAINDIADAFKDIEVEEDDEE